MLTLEWNKVDIANSDIFNGKEQFTFEQMENVFAKALTLGNTQFVRLLIENKLNIDKFLTVRRLHCLYNSSRNMKDIKEAPFSYYFRKKYKNREEIKFDDIKDYIENLVRIKFPKNFFPPSDLAVSKWDNTTIHSPISNLFIWSILFNKPEIARVFLTISKVNNLHEKIYS